MAHAVTNSCNRNVRFPDGGKCRDASRRRNGIANFRPGNLSAPARPTRLSPRMLLTARHRSLQNLSLVGLIQQPPAHGAAQSREPAPPASVSASVSIRGGTCLLPRHAPADNKHRVGRFRRGRNLFAWAAARSYYVPIATGQPRSDRHDRGHQGHRTPRCPPVTEHPERCCDDLQASEQFFDVVPDDGAASQPLGSDPDGELDTTECARGDGLPGQAGCCAVPVTGYSKRSA